MYLLPPVLKFLEVGVSDKCCQKTLRPPHRTLSAATSWRHPGAERRCREPTGIKLVASQGDGSCSSRSHPPPPRPPGGAPSASGKVACSTQAKSCRETRLPVPGGRWKDIPTANSLGTAHSFSGWEAPATRAAEGCGLHCPACVARGQSRGLQPSLSSQDHT